MHVTVPAQTGLITSAFIAGLPRDRNYAGAAHAQARYPVVKRDSGFDCPTFSSSLPDFISHHHTHTRTHTFTPREYIS